MPMHMFYYFDPLYFLFLIPALALVIIAQVWVKSSYNKYAKVYNQRGLTGREAAQAVLDRAGLHHIRIERVAGKLTDHYDPRAQVIRLSPEVYNTPSIAAVGIAAHEAGHAVQHATGYAGIKVRNAILPISNHGPTLGIFLLLIGAVFNFPVLIYFGIALFSFAFLFQLVTLPVEFNASRRALAAIKETGLLTEEERAGARKVLTAAAMTYVAAMLQSLMTLLYYIVRFTGGNRRE